MGIPVKKLKNGFSMPVFGLGTWQMGGRGERDLDNDDRADIQAIGDAIRAGITHVDTAETYAAGYTEILVGKAIKSFDREKLFLVTKVRSAHLHHDDVILSLNNSLNRLQTDYIDLYLVHEPNHKIPLSETMKAMEELVEKGQVRHIGVSNFSVETLKEAQSHCKYAIVANQVHYNLQCREPVTKGLVEYCQNHDVMLIAYRPFEKGMLLETETPIITELSNKYHKTFAQLAINWLISQKNVVTLSKMRNVTHLKENLKAIDWVMADKDWARLEKEFPGQIDISPVCPLS